MSRLDRVDEVLRLMDDHTFFMVQGNPLRKSDLVALVAVARHAAEMYAHEDRYNEQGIGDDEINKAIHAYDVADEALRAALAPLLADRATSGEGSPP